MKHDELWAYVSEHLYDLIIKEFDDIPIEKILKKNSLGAFKGIKFEKLYIDEESKWDLDSSDADNDEKIYVSIPVEIRFEVMKDGAAENLTEYEYILEGAELKTPGDDIYADISIFGLKEEELDLVEENGGKHALHGWLFVTKYIN